MKTVWMLSDGYGDEQHNSGLFSDPEIAKNVGLKSACKQSNYGDTEYWPDPDFDGWHWSEKEKRYSARIVSEPGYYLYVTRFTIIDLSPEVA